MFRTSFFLFGVLTLSCASPECVNPPPPPRKFVTSYKYGWLGEVGVTGVDLVGGGSIYGDITSTSGFVDFHVYGKDYGVALYGLIHDHPDHSVGVRVFRHDNGGWAPELWLHARATNDFSGDLVVERGAKVVLTNLAGFASVSTKTIRVRGGGLYTFIGNQLSREASIHLESGGSFNLGLNAHSVEKIHALNVSDRGVLNFRSETIAHRQIRGARTLFLDDLMISGGGQLIVRNWEDGMHRIFVKKSSWNVENALNRIQFEGYGGGAALRWSSESGHWEVYGKLPEPTTYGAVFAVTGLGIVLQRRRKRRRVAVS